MSYDNSILGATMRRIKRAEAVARRRRRPVRAHILGTDKTFRAESAPLGSLGVVYPVSSSPFPRDSE